MGLSKESISLLMDLVELRLVSMHVDDRDDLKEAGRLRLCRHELLQENSNREQPRLPKISSAIVKKVSLDKKGKPLSYNSDHR